MDELMGGLIGGWRDGKSSGWRMHGSMDEGMGVWVSGQID